MVKIVLQGSHAQTYTEGVICVTRTDWQRQSGQAINKDQGYLP
jgi:hypothetical protein